MSVRSSALRQQVRDTRFDTVAVLLFSLSSGATDAFVFLTFGGVFTANMTGNLVLMGMFSRPAEAVGLAVVAVLSFAAAAYLGFLLDKHLDRHGQVRRIPALLWLSVVFQLAVVVIWFTIYHIDGIDDWGTFVLIGCSAATHALQTAGAKRLPAARGATTTYMTGTMTSLLEDLAYGRRNGRRAKAASIFCLVVGAVLGTAVVATDSLYGPVLPLAAGSAAVLCTWLAAPARRR